MLLLRRLPKLPGSSLETEPPGERGGPRVFRFSQIYRQIGGRRHSQSLPKLPPRLFSVASDPHPCGKTCGAGGPQSPQRKSGAPIPPRPVAATSRASASVSAGRGIQALTRGRTPAYVQSVDTPLQICTRPHRLPLPLVRTFLVASGLPGLEEPGSRRGRPSASARRHSRYSGDLTKRA